MQPTVGVTPPKVEEGRDLPSRGDFSFPPHSFIWNAVGEMMSNSLY